MNTPRRTPPVVVGYTAGQATSGRWSPARDRHGGIVYYPCPTIRAIGAKS